MPDSQTMNAILGAYGISPSAGAGGINWGYWVANILFGVIGWFAFAHGKREKSFRPMIIGIVLMVYPYFISNAILTFAIGIGLTAALYYWRE